MSGVRIGLDIGGTKVHGAAVAADGSVLAQTRAPTARGGEGVVASVVGVLDDLCASVGSTPDVVGVGIPGIVDGAGGVRHAVNLGIGERFPLAEVEKWEAAGIAAVVFDRGGNKYAGRVAALADSARNAGLDF